ncbi:hypothetical protein WA026_000029 [Henosepilachna vigintioctopunctata]|uniref:Major facilitator superfamily (MFS) profile domain-containing protein n=1 Tax=Henosepilachna vigintioctopunctata TaxID=420089 RepID=A0AAW1UXZ6_9CUCU
METWKIFSKFFGGNYIFVVAIIGNFLYVFSGMSLAWPSPVLVKLREPENNPLGKPITPEENDLIGSVFSIGGAIGPVILIYTLELLGRKFTMAILAVLFPLFYTVLSFSETIYLYYVCRIGLGICVGASFSIVPIYISEIVPSEFRGTFMSLGTCFLNVGCFLSYTIGPYISILALNVLIATFSLIYAPIYIFSCPETLYYTMQKHGDGRTSELLKALRKGDSHEEELKEIKSSMKTEENGSIFDIFRSRAGIRAFFICTGLLTLQQFSGINIVITYSESIFKKAGVSISPEVCSIIVSAFQTATCAITPIALKHINIKTLLSISFAGVGLSNMIMCLYFYLQPLEEFKWIPLIILVCFMIFCNCGVASLPWVILGEMYPLKVKSVGTALSTMIYWIFQFIVTYFYNKIDQGLSFLIFTIACVATVVFVQKFLIETKGKSLQEIHECLES